MTDKLPGHSNPPPPPEKIVGMTLQNKYGIGDNVVYQIIRVTDKYQDSQETVLNNGIGEVLEIPELQPALEMVAMLNENSGEGIKYKLRGIKIN